MSLIWVNDVRVAYWNNVRSKKAEYLSLRYNVHQLWKKSIACTVWYISLPVLPQEVLAQISFPSALVSTLIIFAVGEEITKHIHQIKTILMYSLLEKLSPLELKGSVIALSLR